MARIEFLTKFVARVEHRPTGSRPTEPHVRVRWLGTAGHVIETPTTTLLLDPFLTRPSLVDTVFRPVAPIPERWGDWLPARIDAVLLGHSHYDHVLDAPEIARRTESRVVGSRTTASWAMAAGVPESGIDVVPASGRTLRIGDCTVRFVPSLHGRFAAGRVPFDGEVLTIPRLPARSFDYKMGGAFGIHVTTPAGAIYHNGSADLVDAQLDGLHADVLLLGLAGRHATPRYVERMTGLLRPAVLIPTHHDYFFGPMDSGPRLLPGINLGGFFADAARCAPSARIVTPTYADVVALPMQGSVRDVVVYAY